MVFPSFLVPAFEEAELDDSSSSIAAVASTGEVLWVNRSWRRREESFGIPTTTGRSYWRTIAGELQPHIERFFAEALATETVREQDYACPTPAEKRTFRLRVLPFPPHGFLVEHSLVATEPAEPTDPTAVERYINEHGIVLQCGNCRKVRDPETDAWHWVPGLIERPRDRTSHGLCPPCASYFYGQH